MMRRILVVFCSFISLTNQEDPEYAGAEEPEFASNKFNRAVTQNTNKESIVRIKRGGSINLKFKIDQKGLQGGTSIKSCKVR